MGAVSTPFRGIDHFATVVMTRVLADGGPEVFWEVATGAIDWHAAPPRAVWEPTADRFTGAQKTPRGSRGRSVATRMAGGVVHLWAAAAPDGSVNDTAATEALIRRVVRVMGRWSEPFFSFGVGVWNPKPGASDLGRTYDLPFSVAIDMDLEPQPTATIDAVALDPSRSTAGDGLVDAGEPAPV